MINELVNLSIAMRQAQVTADSWQRKYKPLPNISDKAPCIRIILNQGQITGLEAVNAELGKLLRKYGSNQGTYPAMNLQPLYRLTDGEAKKACQQMIQGKAEIDLEKIRSWRVESNWTGKFCKKYAQCLENVPEEIGEVLGGQHIWPPVAALIRETNVFADPSVLHQALEQQVFRMLEQKTATALALRILFHPSDAAKKDDFGTLSAIFDCQTLIEAEIPAATEKFTREFNAQLLQAEQLEPPPDGAVTDAFGHPFLPFDEPMPSVKLAGGFTASLRTMFHGQPSQYRYGKIESGSYPLCRELRSQLQSALDWLGTEDHKDVTWTSTGKNEILFAYPYRLPPAPPCCVRVFKRINLTAGKAVFETEAKTFISSMYGLRQPGTDSNAERIQIFILHKMDKSRTKVLYTRLSNPQEIEVRSEAWCAGTKNLPRLHIGQPATIFPLDTAEILNRFWTSNGELLAEKFRPLSPYHGIDLFFNSQEQAANDLTILIRNTQVVAPLLSRQFLTQDTVRPLFIWQMQQALALSGYLLGELGSRKEIYMEEFAYLYGQLLKVSDALHLLYCKVVRDGDIPPQLAGGSMYMAVADAPLRTMGVLGQRMNPYINWAKTYQYRNVQTPGIESWLTGWLLWLYEDNVKKITAALTQQQTAHFTDMEKAQFFLGFIAAFPKKAGTEGAAAETDMDAKAENNTENGGTENE